MTYEEDDKLRARRRSSKQAIGLAMQGRWREAVDVNRGLVESFGNDVDAYNRLGRAHMELGEYKEARAAYSRALELDPYNVIARKNLNRLSRRGEVAGTEDSSHKVEPDRFIEETGKAGVVSLYRLAPDSVLAGVVAGDELTLRVEGPNLFLYSGRGEYVGMVEPKHALRLVRLMNGGNRYTASVISVGEGTVAVIIREVYQHPSQTGRVSFPPKGFERIRPYVGDRLLRHELEYEEEGEEEPGYYIISSDEADTLPDESHDLDEKVDEA